ncbi:MAG TPA: glycosyltransferase [Pyrinomonadaceae bacterium]|nr:glycosyltransferase [Pyrinomonadaceae bacterium]
MNITVVVPVRNEEHSIRLLLQGLLEQTLPPAEIVIVDGGSTDATRRIVAEQARQHSHLHLIREADALPGKGRNVGAAAAANEWLAFIDAGVSPANDWLAQLAEAVRSNPQTDVVYGAWEPVTDTFFKECAAIAYGNVPTEAVDETFIKSRAIFSSLMRRSVWQAVKGFSEDLRSAEDLLFMKGIDDAGFKVSYAPKAVVRWSMQPNLLRTFRRFVTYSRHNMLAGLWKQWQASLLVRYGLIILGAAILFGLTSWWPIVTVALFLSMLIARATVALWRSRRRYPAGVGRNTARLLVLVPLLATIDAATMVGVAAWLAMKKPH